MSTKEELLQQLHEASAAGDDAKVQAIAKQLLALQPAPYQSPGADPNANPWDQYVHYNQNLGQSPSDYIRNITAKGGKPTPQDLANLAIAFPSAIVEGGVNAAIQGVQGTADAAAGKIDPMDPRNRDWAVGTSLGVAGLAGTGGLSAAVEGPGAVLGAGATRRTRLPVNPVSDVDKYRVWAQWDYPKRVKAGVQDEYERLTKVPGIHYEVFPNSKITPEREAEYRKADIIYQNGGIDDAGYDALLAHITKGGRVSDADVAAATADSQKALDQAFSENPNFLNDQAKALREAVQDSADENPDYVAPPKPVTLNANKDPVVAGLFSTADQAVAKSAQSKATGAQWLGWMKKQPGVKPEELDWRGVTDALTAAGNKPITREELQGILDQNKVQINEVVKGGPDYIGNTPENARTYLQSIGIDAADQPDARAMSIAHAQGWDVENPAPSKYSQYQIPGGENYREILLTTPENGKLTPAEQSEMERIGRAVQYNSSNPKDRMAVSPEDMTKYRELLNKNAVTTEEKGNYKSSHWDEPNVLVHARVNDRMLPNPTPSPETEALHQSLLAKYGSDEGIGLHASEEELNQLEAGKDLRTLNAEEIQSDWHQAGRKQGYNRPPGEGWTAKSDATANAPDAWQVMDKDGQLIGIFRAQNEAGAIQRALTVQDTRGVPDAPFKTTWPDLMLKRLMHEAVDKGYDAISWTDGATQAARYDLSKQIKNLRYNETTGTLQAWDHNGKIALDQAGVPPEKLADYIGKDAADKLVSQKPAASDWTIKRDGDKYVVVDQNGTVKQDFYSQAGADTYVKEWETGGVKELSGVDLKVGGEGMKGFYDKILPSKATKLWGKYGAKVEDMPVGSSTETTSTALDAIDFLEEQGFSRNQLEDQSNADNVRMATDHGWEPNTETSKYGVHVIRITPEMREAIKNGQSLFARGGAVKKHKDDEPEEPRRVAGLDPHMAARYGLEMPPAGVDPITTANSPLASPDVDRYDPEVQSFNERWPEVPTQTLDPEVARKALERRQWAQMFGDVNGFLSGPMLDIDQALNSKRH